jgi:transcriptional regulator with XRE-family HTH domain
MSGRDESAVDMAELATMLRQQRKVAGLSLRELAAETGVPYSTLSRVETGQIPDLSTFRAIVDWLGVPPERFFPTSRVHSESTPEVVAAFLRHDPNLTDAARQQLASVFGSMYAALTAVAKPVTVHLRAQRAFKPEAGSLLADLLKQMETRLTSEAGG